jgi:plasmid stability protein
MANLTISIDPETVKKARIRALEQGTSINAILRDYLMSYAGTRSRQSKAIEDLLELSRASDSARGARRWSRDELYQRGS